MVSRYWKILGACAVILLTALAWHHHQVVRERPILQTVQRTLQTMAMVGGGDQPPPGLLVSGSQAQLLLTWMQNQVAQGSVNPLVKASTRLAKPTTVTLRSKRAVVKTRFAWDRDFGPAGKVQQSGTATLWLTRGTGGWQVGAISIQLPPNTGWNDYWHFAPMPAPPFGIEKTATM